MKRIKEYIKKLLKGEISLLISFWIWFIALSLFVEIFFQVKFSENPFIYDNYSELLLFLFTFIYSILILIIIYRSSKNYKGSKIWSFLAKTLVTINLFFSLSFSFDTMKFYFFEDYAIGKEIENFKLSLPIQVDSTSILIDIYKENKTIFYTYQLLGSISLKDIDKNKFNSKIQNSICEDEGSLDLLKKDYSFNYQYVDENKEEIIKIITDKIHCGKSIYDLEILNDILKKQGML